MRKVKISNGYVPHAKQLRFHLSEAKFKGIYTGVGFGKSAAGANEIIKNCILYPKATHLISAPNSRIMQHATLSQFWKFLPRELLLSEKKSESTIYLINGARIIYLTADNIRHIDRLRGIEIGSFWADESALYLYKFFEVLIGRLRDPHGPLTGVFTSTPKGFEWNYYYFVKKQHPLTRKPLPNPDDYEWFSGTTDDNPYTPDEYKQNLKDQYVGKFKEQEVYGKFVGFEGQVYDIFRPDIHIIKSLPRDKNNELIFKEYAYGIDWGFTNEMACVIVAYDSDGRIYVIDEFYRKKAKLKELAEWLDEMNNKYFLSVGYADPSEPEHIDEMNIQGHGVVQAKNKILPGISDVYKRFAVKEDGKPRLYISEKCINTLDEINQYRYADIKENKEQKEKPLKVNDHLMDALRYVIHSHHYGSESMVMDGDGTFL